MELKDNLFHEALEKEYGRKIDFDKEISEVLNYEARSLFA